MKGEKLFALGGQWRRFDGERMQVELFDLDFEDVEVHRGGQTLGDGLNRNAVNVQFAQCGHFALWGKHADLKRAEATRRQCRE